MEAALVRPACHTGVKIIQNAREDPFQLASLQFPRGGGQGRSNDDLSGVSSNRDSRFWL